MFIQPYHDHQLIISFTSQTDIIRVLKFFLSATVEFFARWKYIMAKHHMRNTLLSILLQNIIIHTLVKEHTLRMQ